MDTECKKCGRYYALRENCEPTPFCDLCAHGEVERLQIELDKQTSVTLGQMQTIRELRGQYKRLHSQVAGYLHGDEWEHWLKYNEPQYAPAESANNVLGDTTAK